MSPPKKQKKAKAKPKVGSKPREKKPILPAAIIEIPASDRGGDTEREGKMSVDWKEDPEILERLTKVAVMMNQNKPAWFIAKETKTSLATAKRDVGRVRELWKEDAKERLVNTTDVALAQYGSIIEDAKAALAKAPLSLKATYMNVIIRAQARMDKVTGIADVTQFQGPGGGPIPIEVTDITKVRDERWKGIEDKLVRMAQTEVKPQENDATRQAGTTTTAAQPNSA